MANANNSSPAPPQPSSLPPQGGELPRGNIEPRKFLFVALESLSGDLAWRLVREGHQVKMYIKEKGDVDVYAGFVERIDSWEEHRDWADIIIFDDVGFGTAAERLRKAGKPVIGGSVYTDRLEIDREFGQQELKKYGVNILPSWQFTDYDAAIQFIKENPARYVFKPSGNTPSWGKGLLFLGQEEDGRDLLELFEQNKGVWKRKAPMFLLQKFIAGVEVAAGAFFNGKDFLTPVHINFEHKRVFPGNIGPFAGEMGTLGFWSAPNTFFKATLEPMLPALREAGYVGYVDINCIVNGRGIYPLEFTTRFGYPTIYLQLEGMLMPAGEWLYRMASGDTFEIRTKKGFQIAVRILVPSYFARKSDPEIEMYHDLAISFKNLSSLEGIHIEDVKNDNGIWRIAGQSGVLLCITATGSTVEEARRIAYKRVRGVMVPNMFYRTDIGKEWVSESDKLHSWGYLY